VGQGDGPHADVDGLLTVQLRRAAGRQDRSGRPDPEDRPYDKWATHWGYAPIPGAKTPKDEKATLDKWAREQDEKPYLRFSTEGNDGTDPGDETEAVGDMDAVRATALGLKNLSRVSEMLLAATSSRVGDPWSELEEVYGRMVSQWQTELNHVVRVVGGFNSQQKHIGQNGVRFTIVPKQTQADAVKFLLNNAFQTPQFMIQPDILRRIQTTGVVERIRTAQNGMMNGLLQSARLDRMVEQVALDGPAAYSPVQFLTDLRKGVWSELDKPGTAIDHLPRTCSGRISTRSKPPERPTAPSDEVRSLLSGELRAPRSSAASALSPPSTDETTRASAGRARSDRDTLNPRAMRDRGGAAGRRREAEAAAALD
jgi:hypothetical protein